MSRTPVREPSRPSAAAPPALEDELRPRLDAGNPQLGRMLRIAFLVVADLSVLLLSGAAAFLIWARPVRGQDPAMYLELAPLAGLFVLGYAQAGLYPGLGLGPVETLRRASYVTLSGFVVLAGATFAVKMPHVYSRATFGVALTLSLLFLPTVRYLVTRAALRLPWMREPVVIVGTGPRARRAVETVRRTATLGYRPVGAFVVPSESVRASVEDVPVLGSAEEVGAWAAAGIQVAILEVDESTDRNLVDDLQRHFRHVIVLRDFDDLPIEGIEIRNFGGFMGVEYTNNLLKRRNRIIKRTMDVVLGTALLLLSLPITLVAALAVKLASPGPAFFRQPRVGLHGEVFPVHKIRTMRVDADRVLEAYLASGPELGREWAERKKLAADPRLIPRVGRFLRRWSVDELPQLWSVVAGTMSLVGPRPFPSYHLEEFSPRFRELRERVRPGVTGMWQVMVRSEGGMKEQEAFDSYYIRNWSVWLDLYLLARTVEAVWSGRGAY